MHSKCVQSTTGTFGTQVACQADTSCKPWACTDRAKSACAQLPSGAYASEAMCKNAAVCQPLKWACYLPVANKTTSTCVQSSSGTFATEATCKGDASCKPKWACTDRSKSTCAVSATGKYADQSTCEKDASCKPLPLWGCSNRASSSCEQSPSGAFATQGLCQADASCHPPGAMLYRCIWFGNPQMDDFISSQRDCETTGTGASFIGTLGCSAPKDLVPSSIAQLWVCYNVRDHGASRDHMNVVGATPCPSGYIRSAHYSGGVFVYTSKPVTDAIQIFSCLKKTRQDPLGDHFVSFSQSCEGATLIGSLGYLTTTCL